MNIFHPPRINLGSYTFKDEMIDSSGATTDPATTSAITLIDG